MKNAPPAHKTLFLLETTISLSDECKIVVAFDQIGPDVFTCHLFVSNYEAERLLK